MRQGKPYVLKMVGCDSINEANAALTEASCLQRLKHPNVVRFEDVFLHRHDNGGCSVSIVMEYCAGGDLIDRIECPKKPLSELSMLRFLESLCHALHHVHCGGVLHRDLKSSNIFVGRHDREVKVCAIVTLDARLSTLTSPALHAYPHRTMPSALRAARRFWARRDRSLAPPPHRLSAAHVAMRHGHVHVSRGRGSQTIRGGIRHVRPRLRAARDACAPPGVCTHPQPHPRGRFSPLCASDLRATCRAQLRERRPFETRKDYICEALELARGRGWDTFHELSELTWRMLDENPKSRIALPAAAASAASALSTIRKNAEAFSIVASKRGPMAEQLDGPRERARPAKLVAADERPPRASTHDRKRRLMYAD